MQDSAAADQDMQETIAGRRTIVRPTHVQCAAPKSSANCYILYIVKQSPVNEANRELRVTLNSGLGGKWIRSGDKGPVVAVVSFVAGGVVRCCCNFSVILLLLIV